MLPELRLLLLVVKPPQLNLVRKPDPPILSRLMVQNRYLRQVLPVNRDVLAQIMLFFLVVVFGLGLAVIVDLVQDVHLVGFAAGVVPF